MTNLKLPQVSGAEVKRALEKIGFVKVGQKGSHVKLKHPDGRIVIVPMHRTLKKGTLRGILRQARLTVEQLLELLKQ